MLRVKENWRSCKSSFVSFAGLRKCDGKDRAASGLSQQRRANGKRPAAVHHVVHEQPGLCEISARLDGKRAVEIVSLLKAVLHFFLRWSCMGFLQHGMKRQIQSPRESFGKFRHERFVIQLRHTSHPHWRRLRIPFTDDFHDGGNQPVVEAGDGGIFSRAHQVAPSGVAPDRQHAAGFRAERI